jgi:hypothetical protein
MPKKTSCRYRRVIIELVFDGRVILFLMAASYAASLFLKNLAGLAAELIFGLIFYECIWLNFDSI